MQLPPSFATAYWEQRANAKAVQEYASGALRNDVCEEPGWLFADRVKEAESALARLELGPVKSLAKMRDLYGATVVVPTRHDIPKAVEAIQATFPGARLQRRTIGSADTFTYDDVHVIATLGERVRVINPGIADRAFEIQVRTGLQFAWWRATHDVLYKGQPGTWRLRRVAAQARAALELLDTTLADITATAELMDAHEEDADVNAERRAGWAEGWPEPQRPGNLVRFAESTATLLDAAKLTLDDAEALLASDRVAELRSNITITPVQLVLGVLIETYGVDWMQNLVAPTRVLVTTELEQAVPAVADVQGSHRARPA